MYKIKKSEFHFAINVAEQKKLLQYTRLPYQLKKPPKNPKLLKTYYSLRELWSWRLILLVRITRVEGMWYRMERKNINQQLILFKYQRETWKISKRSMWHWLRQLLFCTENGVSKNRIKEKYLRLLRLPPGAQKIRGVQRYFVRLFLKKIWRETALWLHGLIAALHNWKENKIKTWRI